MNGRRAFVVALLCASAAASACGGDDDGPAPADGATAADAPVSGPDARAPDAAGCGTPAIDESWLQPYLQEIVAKLAGAMPIASGVTLTDRASLAARDATRTYLMAELTALGYTAELRPYETGANVVARLPATTAVVGGTIVMGAHFDGVPNVPAAADDGTGTALVLTAARWMRGVDCRSSDVVFAFFDEEELGLVGSNYFAADLVASGEVVAAVHVFDMISWDADGDRAVELWSPTPALAQLYMEAGAALGMPIQPVMFGLSDHQSFLDTGFVTAGVSEEFVAGDHTPHYHLATDTYDKINFEFLADVTGLTLSVVAGQLDPGP